MNIRWGDFGKFLRESYMPGVAQLFEEFKASCRECGGDYSKFQQINPFCQPMYTILTDGKSAIRCGAGHNAISITTDGRYLCCPVASDEAWNNIGTLKDAPMEQMDRVVIGGQCNECADRDICGGRCLYANHTMHWGKDGFQLVCTTVKQILDLCRGFKEELTQLIQEGRVAMEWFQFPNERYSLETIP